MNEELKSEQNIREFLLGRLSEDDRTAFEDALLLDGDFFNRVRLVEEELLESYARGEMSGTQRADFELAFLTTELRRERVEFNKALAESLKSGSEIPKPAPGVEPVGILASLRALFHPRFAFAAFALLLVVFAVWVAVTRFRYPAADLALSNSDTKKDGDSVTANEPQQPDSNLPRSPTNSARVEPENVAANSPDRPSAETDVTGTEKKMPTPAVKAEDRTAKVVKSPVLVLVAGRLRSDGTGSIVTIPENAKGLILRLEVKESESKAFSIELRNADDMIVYRRSGLLVRNGQASLLVPAEVLKKGDYAIEIFGTSQSAVRQSISDYQFRVQ